MAMDPEMQNRTVQSKGNFWRLSKVAIKSGLIDKFWELDQINQAWVIATIETEEDLEAIVSYVQMKELDKDKPKIPTVTRHGRRK